MCRTWPLIRQFRGGRSALRRSGSILFVLTAATCASPADDSTLDEIRAGYRQALSSLESVHATYHYSVRFKFEGVANDYDSEIEWAFDGDRYFYQSRPVFPETGELAQPTLVYCDGEHRWDFEHSPFDLSKVDVVWKRTMESAGDSWFWQKNGLSEYLGRRLNLSKHTLQFETIASLLEGEKAEVVDREDVLGARSWRVDLGRHQAPADTYWAHPTVWFDPASGYLPRKIVMWTSVEEDPTVYRVFEFLRRETVVGTVWFPCICERETLISTADLVVDEISINEPLAADEYHVPIPHGTPVVDSSDVARARRFRQELGQRRAAQRRALGLVPAAPRPEPIPAEVADYGRTDARPRFGWPWSGIFLVAGLLALAFGTAIAIRQRTA